jgi:hypothetical protein
MRFGLASTNPKIHAAVQGERRNPSMWSEVHQLNSAVRAMENRRNKEASDDETNSSGDIDRASRRRDDVWGRTVVIVLLFAAVAGSLATAYVLR